MGIGGAAGGTEDEELVGCYGEFSDSYYSGHREEYDSKRLTKRGLRKQYAVIGKDADLLAIDAGEALVRGVNYKTLWTRGRRKRERRYP